MLNGTTSAGDTGYYTIDFQGGKIVFLTFNLQNSTVGSDTTHIDLAQLPDSIKPAVAFSASVSGGIANCYLEKNGVLWVSAHAGEKLKPEWGYNSAMFVYPHLD